jgi:hypothetical protein
MRDNRLARFCEWPRDAPILAGLWLLDRISGPYPETEADRIRERSTARLRCSLAWISKGPAAMPLDLDDDERATLVELVTAEIKGTRYPLSPRLRPLKSILAKLAMGIALLLPVTLCVLPSLAVAQRLEGSAAVEQKDIGRLSVQTQTYNQALGVVSELKRASAAQTVECNGTCYFPNSSKAIAWRCAPTKTCSLHCTVDPPVGGCD